MKTFLLLIFSVANFLATAQTTFTYTGNGNWTDEENWSPSFPGTTINTGEEVIITEGSTVSISTLILQGNLINRGVLQNISSFNNNGVFINENEFSNRSIFTNRGVITNNGVFTSISFFVNNGELINNGDFQSSLHFGNNISHTSDFHIASIFSPGNSSGPEIGTYTFDDNLSIGNSANLTIEIRSSTEVDVINVTGTATISGRLNVSLLDNYNPEIGDNFTVLTAGNVNNTFNTANFPNLEDNKEFRITYNDDSIILEVIDSRLLSTNDLDPNKTEIVMYPNPVNDVLHIGGLNTTEKVIIYSVVGTKLQEYTVDPSNNKIPLNNLVEGPYLLSAGNTNYKFMKN